MPFQLERAVSDRRHRHTAPLTGLSAIKSNVFPLACCVKIMFTHHHRISKYAVYPCPPGCRFHAAVIAISLHWSSEAFLLISSISCMAVPFPAGMFGRYAVAEPAVVLRGLLALSCPVAGHFVRFFTKLPECRPL